MKTLILLCLATVAALTSAHGLDADGIKALAAKPHSREGLLEELKIYPVAREYRISVIITTPGEKPHKPDSVTAKEKVVEGKYLVSTYRLPSHEEDTIMVVTFDRETRLYHKWVLIPDGTLGQMLGTSVKGSMATIAWRSIEPIEPLPGKRTPLLSIEHHSPMETTWVDIYFEDGEELYRVEGSAKVTKRE